MMSIPQLATFLSGALMATLATAGLFFLRFWRQTRDPLFKTFAFAFWMMAVERLFLIAINAEQEGRTYVYLIRLVAFLLIIKAIYDKNRPARSPAEAPPTPLDV